MTNAVSVDFVEDVACAVRVLEAVSVDGAALLEWAGEWVVGGSWNVGARWVGAVGYCDADAVAVWVGGDDGGVVHYVFSVGLCIVINLLHIKMVEAKKET